MNYLKIYNDLILRARNRKKLEGYCEKHHILPKCLGGGNEKTNIVKLSAREHFVAHLLLIKIYPEKPSLIYAIKMMTMGSKRINNKMYEWLRIKEALISSDMNKGINNPFYGKKHSDLTKKKISEERKKIVVSDETKMKIKESRKNITFDRSAAQIKAAQTRKSNGQPWHSSNTKLKIKESKQFISEDTKKKISTSKKGSILSNITKEKMSKSHKGIKPWNVGLETSASTKDKISKSMTSVELYSGNEFCEYGCNQPAKYKKYAKSKSRNIFMCEKSHNSCNGFKKKKRQNNRP